MTIQAYAAMSAKSSLVAFQYAPPELGEWEVEVQVTHCGICHSDVHLVDNDWGISQYPLVPGHEVVGNVVALGAKVQHLKAGDRVGVGWQCGACMTCEFCVQGQENLCRQARATCLGHHGGFAQALRVDGRFAFKIPEALASANAAPLLCGGVTVYSPLRFYEVHSAMRVGVIGIGGLGHFALQFARAFGCEVTAFSSSPDKSAEAQSFGAHHFVVASDRAQMKQAQGSLDFIISTATADLDWASYFSTLRPRGKLCFVGVPPQPVSIPAFMLIEGNKSICGSNIGGRAIMQEMLEFAARHRIQAQTEILPMSEVNTGMLKVRQNQARYRMVLQN